MSQGHQDHKRILVCSVNWIGDAIMSMPAMQALRREEPSAHIVLLVKPNLGPLWSMHVVPDEIVLPKQSDLLDGKDTIHEAALTWLRDNLKQP